MMHGQSIARQYGFTLLEVLVAISLFALISVVLNQGLSFAIKSVASVESKAEELQHLIVIANFFKNGISGSKQVRLSGSRQMAFQGEVDSIRFVSKAPQAMGASAYVVYELKFDFVSAQKKIRVRINPFSVVESGIRPVSTTVALDDIDSIKLSYFGRRVGDHSLDWHKDWSRQRFLPLLVKMEMWPRSGLIWPPVIIQLNNADNGRRN